MVKKGGNMRKVLLVLVMVLLTVSVGLGGEIEYLVISEEYDDMGSHIYTNVYTDPYKLLKQITWLIDDPEMQCPWPTVYSSGFYELEPCKECLTLVPPKNSEVKGIDGKLNVVKNKVIAVILIKNGKSKLNEDYGDLIINRVKRELKEAK